MGHRYIPFLLFYRWCISGLIPRNSSTISAAPVYNVAGSIKLSRSGFAHHFITKTSRWVWQFPCPLVHFRCGWCIWIRTQVLFRCRLGWSVMASLCHDSRPIQLKEGQMKDREDVPLVPWIQSTYPDSDSGDWEGTLSFGATFLVGSLFLIFLAYSRTRSPTLNSGSACCRISK